MKMFASALFTLLFCLSLIAQQTQVRGVITVFRSKHETGKTEYVQYAAVNHAAEKPKAQQQLTDANGQFTLIFRGVNPSETVHLRVEKEEEDLEVVNSEALQAVSGQKEQVKIWMCNRRKLAKAQLQFQNNAATAAFEALEKKEKEARKRLQTLEKQTKADQQQIAALRQELSDINNQFQKIDELVKNLAAKYARINLDDMPPLYAEAYAYFERGELDLALQVFNRSDLNKKTREILDARTRTAALRVETALQDSLNRAKTKETMQEWRLKADLYRALSKWDSVEICYRGLLTLDDNNLENLWDFADFLEGQNQHKEATPLYEKCLDLAGTEDLKATFLNSLGSCYYNLHRPADAKKHFLLAFEIQERLAKNDPVQFEPDLAMVANNLGEFYRTMSLLSEAEEKFLVALRICEKLVKRDAERFEPDLALTANSLGVFYADIDRPVEAENKYLLAFDIRKKLAESNFERYGQDLAQTAHSLGIFYADNNHPVEAENKYLLAFDIRKKLAESNFEQFGPDLAHTANSLGIFYTNNNRLVEAENNCLLSLEIFGRLAKNDPEQFEPHLARAANSLGGFYYTNNRISDAEKHYLDAFKVYQRLVKINPAQFELGFAMTANNLGVLYQNDNRLIESEKNYLLSFGAYQNLAKRDPVRFESGLAVAANNLGTFYNDQNRLAAAEEKYLQAFAIRERLAKSNPAEFERDLAMTAYNLGAFYFINNRFADAERTYQQAYKIYKRLAEGNPAQYEPYLAAAANNYGVFCMSQQHFEQAKQLYGQALVIRQKEVLSGQSRILKDLMRTYDNIGKLRDSFEARRDYRTVVSIQRERTVCMDSVRHFNPALVSLAAEDYGRLSWNLLFIRDYATAESSARRALTLDPSQNWVRTNLGHTLLFRGEWAKAQQIYQEYLKNETDQTEAKKLMRKDWDDLEAAGITCPDMKKARVWLK